MGSLAAEEGFGQLAEGEAEGWGWDWEEGRAAEVVAEGAGEVAVLDRMRGAEVERAAGGRGCE